MTQSTPTTPTFAVIYTRVSTDAQTLTPSLDVQEQQARARAESLGARIVSVHRDEGLSGALYHARAGLQDALAAAESLRRDYPAARILFVCARLDRAGRDVGTLVTLRRRLRAIGAELHLADGLSTPDTAAGNLVGNTLGAIAEFERSLIRERTMAGKRSAAQEGRQPHRRLRPFGFYIVQKSDIYPGSPYDPEHLGHYVIVEDEARHVRAIFAGYAAGEMSLRGAARYLHGESVPTVNGGTWSATTVSGMLKNPAYEGRARCGYRSWWREEQEEGVVKTKSRRLPESDCVFIPCPPIVPEEIFARVQMRLATNQKTFSGDPTRRYLLSGLARCPVCGRGLFAAHGASGVVHYRCRQAKRSSEADGVICNPRHYRADLMEAMVMAALAGMVNRPEVIGQAVAAMEAMDQAPAPSDADRARSLAELSRKEMAAVQAQVEAMAAGRDATPYRRVLESIEKRRREIESDGARQSPERPRFDPEELRSRLSQVMSFMSSAAPAERIRALRMIVQSVVPAEKGDVLETNLFPLFRGGTVERITIRSTVRGIERVSVVWDEPGEGGNP